MQDISDLEQEFELETENAPVEEGELESEFESLAEPDEGEGEVEEGDAAPAGYAERLQELSNREFESESELDRELDDVMHEMERDFFLGGLVRRAKQLGKNPLVRQLAKKAAGYAVKRIPALQAVKGLTQLASGNLRGALKQMALAGLSSAVPGASVALPALQSLGLGTESETSEGWDQFVEFSREAYEDLANNVNEEVDDPAVAANAANNAFQSAYQKVYGGQRRGRSGRVERGRKQITVKPGDVIVIKVE